MRRYRSTVSPGGAKFTAKHEGGQSKDGLFHPYFDKLGQVWTIGFGHTEGVTKYSKSLTLRQATALLRYDLNKKYAPPVARLTRALGLRLEAYEFNALVDVSYNLGFGVFGIGHDLGDALRTKDRRRIADSLLVYTKAADGSHPAGLVNRRHAERTYFLTGKDVA